MKKILFIIGDMERGGAQRVVSILANKYANSGHQVTIAVLLHNGAAYDLHENVSIVDLGVSGNNYLMKAPFLVIKLRKHMRLRKYDVVVSFVGRVNLITLFSHIGLKNRLIVSERNDPEYDNRNKIELWLCRKLYKYADKVVFQTNYQKKWYGRECNRNAVIIGNPIEMSEYYGKHTGMGVISVGKLMPQKNHSMEIKAFAQIANKIEYDLYIYGDGDEKASLTSLAKQLGVIERIHFCGNIKNIDDVLENNKWFIMTSNYEGLSNALIEAMIKGMVCISTKWNGVEDLIIDGKNGFLVEKGDIDGVANMMLRVANIKNDEYQSISENAINTACSFKVENIISQWNDALDI